MNYKLMFKSQFLIAEELQGKEATITIERVEMKKLEQDDGRKKDKGIIYFRGSDRGWVLGRTNAMCLAAMFSEETDAWIGKRVTLFATEVQLGGERVLGIRVKGSPDLKDTISAEIKLPRKRPFTMKLTPTSKAAKADAPVQQHTADDDPPEVPRT